MAAPTLGVLVTYYEEGEMLRDCLRSLLEQPSPPDEILVHDDASKLPAKSVIPPEWPVRVVRSETNAGPSHGRNRLLDAATADYVHFHDADDWFAPDWCRKVRAAIEAERRDAVFTEVTSHENDRIVCEKVVGLETLEREKDLLRFCLVHAMLVPAGTYRRQLLRRMGGYRTELWQSEDFEFHARLAAAGLTYTLLPEPLVHIRLHPGSRSRDQAQVWTCRLQAIRLLFLVVPPAYHPVVAQAALHAGSKLFQIGRRDEARRAFQLARELGPPSFEGMPALYRWIARSLGLEAAERLGQVYRHCLPSGVREWVRSRTG